MGVYFMIKIYLKVYSRRSVTVTIYDSLKKLPFSIDRIAQTFKLPVLKGVIDYHSYRSNNHILTEEEQNYLDNDTEIMARALNTQFENGLEKMTIASDALNNFKSTLVNHGKQKREFNYRYPALSVKADSWIRASYKGGYVYLKPEYSGKDLSKSTSYDVNSLYPAVMYNSLLPYGVPIRYEGKYEQDDNYPLYIQHIRVMFRVKEGHLPTIQAKGNPIFQPTDYLMDSSDEVIDLFLTSVDLELFIKHHEIDYIEYIEGMKFKGSHDQFKTYIDHWSEIKETTEGGERELAKLMLNSLYGKFASKLEKIRRIPYLDEKTNKVRFSFREEELGKPIYTATASFITAYAREITISAAQDNYASFIYADTDSIHLIGHDIPETLDIHDTELGKWGHEGNFGRSKFIRAKTYIKDDNGVLDITCAGLPNEARENVTFENFKAGAVYEGKLSNHVVPGGSLLRESTFTIADV